MKSPAELYRKLPSTDELLRQPQVAELTRAEGHAAVTDACRAVLVRLRGEISAGHLDGEKLQMALSEIGSAVCQELRRALGYSLRPVINATGVILHTNLGRAPIARSALDHILETAAGYSNLEFDLGSGERGKRDVHVERWFTKLLAEKLAELSSVEPGRAPVPTPSVATPPSISTIVVNNNAAAVLLGLNTLAEGGEVIVSRGELVEIGGSFRIPDVMGKSGAILREVGTTNRTRISDYARAISERTRLLLRVHRSNFEISGFTEQPAIRDLVTLAHKHNLPLMEDLGSGALFDLRQVGIQNEPGVLDSLRSGVDVVTYSGDKLLGGPQAGLVSGATDLIQKMRSNSLFRALRVDKLTYAALEATLSAYVRKDYTSLPALRMIEMTKTEITSRAESLILAIHADKPVRSTPHLRAELTEGESLIGGGAAPSATLPTTLIAFTCDSLSADTFAARLRAAEPPVLARVDEGRVLLDLRTVFPEQDEILSQVLVRAAGV